MSRLIYEYTWRYRGRIGGGLLFSLLATSLGLATPWLLRQAIDTFSSGGPDAGSRLSLLAAAIVGVALAEGFARFWARYLVTGASRWVEYDLRNRYFAHLERFEPAFFQRHRTGDLVARATNDLSAVRQLFGPAFYHVASTLFLVALSLALMFQISRTLALWAAGVLPLATLVFAVTRTRLQRGYTRVQEQFAAMADHAQETFAGERVVKAYAQEAAETETFRRTSEEYVQRQLAQIRVSGLLWPSMALVIGLLVVVLLYVGGQEVVAGRISLGELVQFNAYVGMLAFPTMAMGWVATMWQQGTASLRRIEETLDEQPTIADAPVLRQAQEERGEVEPRGEIKLRDVTVRVGERTILDRISLRVPAGATLALVGPLGSGKSTLVNLLGRLIEPTSGQVLLDGVDVRDLPLADLRQRIAYVPQETFLFSGSLADNVAYGLSEGEATAARIRQAVQLSQLEKDLDQWPAGLETTIGERGVTLSGGQKQRTAIARALARDSQVLVLDDALSSVDTRTEEAVLRGLAEFMAHRTSIVIAHRLSTTRLADRVVVLCDGRIAEQGTHLELVQRGGVYTQMYRRQLIAQELEVEDDATPARQPAERA